MQRFDIHSDNSASHGDQKGRDETREEERKSTPDRPSVDPTPESVPTQALDATAAILEALRKQGERSIEQGEQSNKLLAKLILFL